MLVSINGFTKIIDIKQIITIYYFEFSSDYVYDGEFHNFWELVYVDKGEINVAADDKNYVLKQGDIIFHRPNEFHSISASNKIAPNIVIISFDTSSPAMSYFEKKMFKVPKDMCNLIANILNEAEGTFKPYHGVINLKEHKLASPVFGSEQMMYGYLEFFLIELYRFFQEEPSSRNPQEIGVDAISPTQSGLINDIIDFMRQNLDKNIKIQDITKKFFIGNTYLKVLFKKCTDDSALYYFRKLKMKEAKRLIREQQYNISEIAKMLGFNSIHYFSASFKKHFGVSPTEYLNMIKLKEGILKSQSDV